MTRKVMVIDDDMSVLFTAKVILEDASYEVECVEDAATCIQRIENGYRGLLLVDVMMPRTDGWELIRALRDNGLLEGNLVCMLTAVTHPGEEMEDIKEFIVDYIRKPFVPNELVGRVQENICYLQ